MSAAPLEVVETESEVERLAARVAHLEAEMERIGKSAVLHHGETDDDVAQAGFNHIRALCARVARTT